MTLLNDRTVRIRDNITGVGSGFAASGKEIAFATYDGVTGLVTHPYTGFKTGRNRKGGPVWGVAKGVVRGFGGLVFRTGAAVFGIPGYTLKGLQQEATRWYIRHNSSVQVEESQELKVSLHETAATNTVRGSNPYKRLIESRIWQGLWEMQALCERPDEYAEVEATVVERWEELSLIE